MFITGFSPSVVRASVMGIMILLSKIIYRKNDIWTSMSISLLILLIYNPFLIKSTSVQFTYIATIGIVLFQKNIFQFFKNIRIKDSHHILRKKQITNKKIIYILNSTYEILSVSFAAQIAIFPISIIYFNSFGLTFFITNFLISFLIPPIIILGLILVILILIEIPSFYIINMILKSFINLLIIISKLGNKLPFNNILVTTPSILEIIVYYIIVIIINYLYSIFQKKQISAFERRIKNIVYLIKCKIRENKKNIYVVLIISIIINIFISIIPRNLRIHFIDVGQGDSTLIITPYNKTILIDGGGSDYYDVGKNILVPYLLDRRIKKIDYIIVSHFDNDHVRGLFQILRQLEVKQVIISKQGENSENFQQFIEIVKDRKIKVIVVKKRR